MKIGKIWTAAGGILAALTLAVILILGANRFAEAAALPALGIQLGVMLLSCFP